jgi:choline dehydrogenase-like flavoprotein
LIMYPSRVNIDSWGKLGNAGWSFDELAPYYKKFSTVHTPGPNATAVTGLGAYHDEELSGNGPLQVSFSEEYTPATQGAWIESFKSLGWKMSADPRTGKAIGAFQNPASIDPKSKTRSFSATAYYGAEARARNNLVVVTEALVKKITTEKSGGEILATGVIIQTKEGEKVISARREVILAAGALQSPQILELSGIGDKELLQSHGIPVVLDNPGVGEHLQDHAFTSQSFEVADGVPSADAFRDPSLVQAVAQLYASNNGAGPLGMSPLVNAYLPLVDQSGPVSAEAKKILLDNHLEQSLESQCLRDIVEASDEPTGQYLFLPFQLVITPNPKDLTELLAPVHPENYMTLVTVLSHPFSRGSVHIISPDINVKPEWDPKYMSHPLDLEILARHVQYGEKFMRTPPFSAMLKPGGKRLPEIVGDDLEHAKEIVRQHQVSIFHPSGSLPMLPREKGGVVNERLVVHGTRNLRVVDASIFPLQTLGTIQATVYAVAERAADFILEDFRK